MVSSAVLLDVMPRYLFVALVAELIAFLFCPFFCVCSGKVKFREYGIPNHWMICQSAVPAELIRVINTVMIKGCAAILAKSRRFKGLRVSSGLLSYLRRAIHS